MWSKLRHYFIPHEGNDYTPHLLQRVAMVAMFGLVLLTFSVANLYSVFWQMSDWLVTTILPGVIVELTNDERAENGAGSLSRSTILDAAATLKAEDMAKNSYFAHYSPTGISPWYWFDQAGYTYAHAGENLAIHFTNSDAVVEAWMNSPTHRANIVDQKFTQIGVGTARGTYQGFDTVYVVQLFGTPALAAPPTTIVTEDVIEVGVPSATTTIDAIEVTELVVESETEAAAPRPFNPVLAEVDSADKVPASESTANSGANNGMQADTEVVTAYMVTASSSASTTDTTVAAASSTESPTTTEVVVADVAVEDDTVSLYSNTVATSSGRAVASPTELAGGQSDPITSVIGRVATQPSNLLFALYLVLSVFVAGILFMSIVIEMRQQRPVQIAYGFALLLLMGGLFYVHMLVTPGVVVA